MQYIQSNTSTQTVYISSLRRSADVPITVRRRSAAVLPTCHTWAFFNVIVNHVAEPKGNGVKLEILLFAMNFENCNVPLPFKAITPVHNYVHVGE